MNRRALACLLLVAGCRPPALAPRPVVPTLPADQARCKVAASHESPLITEWPATEKANLESMVREGGVVVSFSGCAMKVLPRCRARAAYGWIRTTPSVDYLEIQNEDELYAKLPLGAASLEGELKGSGRLVVQTTVSGQLRLPTGPGGLPEVDGDCASATHVVGALAIGAFELRAGGTSSAKASVEVATVAGARAAGSASEQVIRMAGNAASCANATEQAADASCASPIQMFLLPVRAPASTAPAGAAAVPPVRPAGGPIGVEILSAEPDTTWDVVVDGRRLCRTPCRENIEPSRALLLRERNSIFTRTSKVTVANLDRWAQVGGVQIKAHPVSTWSFSGLARMGGIFYGLIGAGFLVPCYQGSADFGDQACTVSGITLGMGIGLFALGTWMMSNPGRAEAEPLTGGF